MTDAPVGGELATLVARAEAWIDADPDPQTRRELAEVVAAASSGDADAGADLADRFRGELRFGTAGLRGPLGAGPNRMNLAVVTRAAHGVAQWLDGHGGPDAAERGVAVCFDARHRSRDFAEATAAVVAAAGIRAHLLAGPLPTPVLAHAVRHLGAAAGVMVTASHNPPRDNGYKVYDGTGRQIVAPADAQIAEAMAAAGAAVDVPVAPAGHPGIVAVGPDVVEAYVAGAARCGLVADARRVRVAYTAMHGVGAAVLHRVFRAAGFDPPVDVADQVAPDPDFPTVAFPNPEEPGALDLGIATASAAGADVLLANDPDADRLGVAVPEPDGGGGWRTLRGDEIGAVLADHLLRHGGVGEGETFATTIVSSTLLGKMAAHHGVRYVETLTGFKWISRAAWPDGTLAFGYEEALGYCVGDLVPDKDGITAALVFAEAVAAQALQGRTVLDVLDDLARTHGVHCTGQWTVRLTGGDAMSGLVALMAGLRADPPTRLAGRPVRAVIDLIEGDPGRGLPASDVVILRLEGARVVVRPSGTEPKLKCYLEVERPVGADGDLAAARRAAAADLDELTGAIASTVDT